MEEVKQAVRAVEEFYNNERPHMSIDMMTPVEAASMIGEITKRWRSYRDEALKNKAIACIGRRPIDCILMFKILFLQRINNLSDHDIHYLIVDCFSFRMFLNIESAVDVPDEKTIEKTIWAWRERLT